MRKYLNNTKKEWFRIVKNTLELKVENKEIDRTIYFKSLIYLKDFIYRQYKISRQEVELLVFGYSRVYQLKKIFRKGNIEYI